MFKLPPRWVLSFSLWAWFRCTFTGHLPRTFIYLFIFNFTFFFPPSPFTFKQLSELNLLQFYNAPLGLVSLQWYQMALSFVLVSDSASVFLRTYTCTAMSVCVFFVLFFPRFSVHCVDTIPAFMRLLEPICVPAGAILARRRPPLGTIWAPLKAVSSPPPLSSSHCDQSYLL